MAGEKLFNALVATLAIGMSPLSVNAQPWHQGAPKYLIAWMSDQYMDGSLIAAVEAPTYCGDVAAARI